MQLLSFSAVAGWKISPVSGVGVVLLAIWL
jgi:hypothetical protein